MLVELNFAARLIAINCDLEAVRAIYFEAHFVATLAPGKQAINLS